MSAAEQLKQDVERHQRMLAAVTMREANKTYPEIAAALGISVTSAWNYVWEYIEHIPDYTSEKIERLRNRELARVERVIVRLWGAIENPDDEVATKAAGAFLKASERRAKLLGLDAPSKVEVENVSEARKKLQAMTPEERIALFEQKAAEERAKLQETRH